MKRTKKLIHDTSLQKPQDKIQQSSNFASTIYSNQKHMTLQVLTIANCRIKTFLLPSKASGMNKFIFSEQKEF